MIRLKLSDSYCREVAPAAKNTYVYDSQISHLALKVTPAGGKSFYYIRSVSGKMRYIRIGPFPAVSVAGARSAALHLAGTLQPHRLRPCGAGSARPGHHHGGG